MKHLLLRAVFASALLIGGALFVEGKPAGAADAPCACTPSSDATSAFILAVHWRARDAAAAEEIAALLPQLEAATRREPGVISFLAHRSPESPIDFFLYEQYRDEAANLAHQQTPHFRELVQGRAAPLLVRRDRMRVQLIPAAP